MHQLPLPLRVRTLEEVLDRLCTGYASFEDWLDCAVVSRTAGRWDLVAECANRALASALRRPLPKARLGEAAHAFVAGSLPRASIGPEWLGRGAAAVREAREMVAARRREAQHASLQEVLDDVLRDLDSMLLLMADDEAPSMVKLASILRDYERPDLAVVMAERVLALSRLNYYALTVRAAARMDLGDPRGVEDAQRAFDLGRSEKALACLSRGLRLAGRADEAVEVALRLLDLQPTRSSAALLAAAALQANDAAAYERALEVLGGPEEGQVAIAATRQIRLLAASQLFRDGQLDQARSILLELVRERRWQRALDLLAEIERREELTAG